MFMNSLVNDSSSKLNNAELSKERVAIACNTSLKPVVAEKVPALLLNPVKNSIFNFSPSKSFRVENESQVVVIMSYLVKEFSSVTVIEKVVEVSIAS